MTYGEHFADGLLPLPPPEKWILAVKIWSEPTRIVHISGALELNTWHLVRFDGTLGVVGVRAVGEHEALEGMGYDVLMHNSAHSHSGRGFFGPTMDDSSHPFYVGNAPIERYLELDPSFCEPIVGGAMQLDELRISSAPRRHDNWPEGEQAGKAHGQMRLDRHTLDYWDFGEGIHAAAYEGARQWRAATLRRGYLSVAARGKAAVRWAELKNRSVAFP